jgi:hypothetical protein
MAKPCAWSAPAPAQATACRAPPSSRKNQTPPASSPGVHRGEANAPARRRWQVCGWRCGRRAGSALPPRHGRGRARSAATFSVLLGSRRPVRSCSAAKSRAGSSDRCSRPSSRIRVGLNGSCAAARSAFQPGFRDAARRAVPAAGGQGRPAGPWLPTAARRARAHRFDEAHPGRRSEGRGPSRTGSTDKFGLPNCLGRSLALAGRAHKHPSRAIGPKVFRQPPLTCQGEVSQRLRSVTRS